MGSWGHWLNRPRARFRGFWLAQGPKRPERCQATLACLSAAQSRHGSLCGASHPRRPPSPPRRPPHGGVLVASSGRPVGQSASRPVGQSASRPVGQAAAVEQLSVRVRDHQLLALQPGALFQSELGLGTLGEPPVRKWGGIPINF